MTPNQEELISILQTQANEIRNEVKDGANTAARIGAMFSSIIGAFPSFINDFKFIVFDGFAPKDANISMSSLLSSNGSVLYILDQNKFGIQPEKDNTIYLNWSDRYSYANEDGVPLFNRIYLNRTEELRPYVYISGHLVSFHAVYSAATQAEAGLMSAADKQKLDGLPLNARDICYCMDIKGGTPPTAAAVAGTRVVVRGDKGDAVWVYVPDGVWAQDEWSCPGGRLRSDLIYAVKGGADAPPDLYVALVKRDGNTVLNAVATENWISRNGFYNYVEASDDIEAAEAGEPGTLRLRLTDSIKKRLGTNVEAVDAAGVAEAVDGDDLTATALRKTEQALTAAERVRVLANLGDPQWGLLDAMWLAAGDVGGEQVTSVDHSQESEYECLGVRVTAAEAAEICAYYRPTEPQELTRGYGNARVRVLLPVRLGDDQAVTPLMFAGAARLEALMITRANGSVPALTFWNQLFDGCQKLRLIAGTLAMGSRCTTASLAFRNCYALEEVRIAGLCVSIDFGRSSRLSFESVAYMMAHAANTSAITITLHADAFARLTPGLIAAAAEKQITFAQA